RQQKQAEPGPETQADEPCAFHRGFAARLEISANVTCPNTVLSAETTGRALLPDQSISANASRSDNVSDTGGPCASPASTAAPTGVSDRSRNGRSFIPTRSATN